MKINNLFYYIAFFSLVLGFLSSLPFIQNSISWSVDQLGTLQKENIVEIYKNSFNEKRVYLKNLSNISKSDANLSGAYVLSKESNDPYLLKEILEKFKIDSNLSYFELIDLNKLESNHSVVNSCLKVYLKTLMSENLCQNQDNVMMSLVAPIFLYGEKVALMFLAVNLNFDMTLNNRKNELFIESLNDKLTNTKIYELNGMAVTTNLYPDLNSLNKVTDRLRYLVLMGSILSLIFMVVFITFATKKLFLNPFNSILDQLNDAYNAIQNKKYYKFSLKNSLVLENTKLAETLDNFLIKIIDYGNQLDKSHQQLIENERNATIGKISRQVAHDIRSPLTALKIVASKVNELPEAHRNLLLTGVDRISNIANQLLDSYKATTTELPESNLKPISYVSQSIEELILQFRLICEQKNMELIYHSNCNPKTVIPIENTQFRNIISNFIANSIEASSSNSKINVTVDETIHSIKILIQDYGKGIPNSILNKLGNEEVTFGKSNGNGLGVFSAKQLITKANGKLNISSEEGKGTQIQITLPKISTESQKLDSIVLEKGKKIVIVDDDKSVHELWRHRLNELSVEQTVLIHHMMTGPEFSEWMDQMDSSKTNEFHFFVDYDFHDQNYNGLTLIEKFKLKERAVLVTAHHSDIDVLASAKKLSVPVLSKASLATIDILVQ